MPVKEGRTSKSESVRQYLRQHPDATNQQVINGLREVGVEVNANLVNQVRHDYKHKQVKEVRAATSGEPIIKVKKLADELGGIDTLIRLAFTLQRILVEEANRGNKEE